MSTTVHRQRILHFLNVFSKTALLLLSTLSYPQIPVCAFKSTSGRSLEAAKYPELAPLCQADGFPGSAAYTQMV